MGKRQDTKTSESGLTLVELVISVAIVSLIVVVLSGILAGALDSWRYTDSRNVLIHTAQLAIERMASKVRATSMVLLPLKISDPTAPGYPASSYFPRYILAISGNIDNDGDNLNDEDPDKDITADGASGIMGVDDDSDGAVDEGSANDDDEDESIGEDPIDGVDNDGDGRVDEDPLQKFYGNLNDDDNDGQNNEDSFDPIIYYLSGSDLLERQDIQGVTTTINTIADNVSEFIVLRRRVNGNTLIDIHLKLDDGSESVELDTTVLARGMFKP